MTKFRRGRPEYSDQRANVDMTPMLDIVFILLIFFIVAAVFMNEKGLSITTPGDGVNGTSSRTIAVHIFANDTASVDGTLVSLEAVSAQISKVRVNRPGLPVSIQADYEAGWRGVVFVKDQMDAASIPNIVRVLPEI